MSPADIAASALGCSAAAVCEVESIKHGLTNESWRVRIRDEQVVVRMTTANERALHIDRENERRVLALVSAAGVGAPLIHCDPRRSVLVTRYLGAPWTYEQGRLHTNILRLAALLQRLHRLAAPGVRRVDLAAEVAGYLHTLEMNGGGGALLDSSQREKAARATALLARGGAPRLCHNDVHHLNVIEDSELRLIDWEYAGLGEPLFDLASVCVYHSFDRGRRETLLSAYDPAPTAELFARLDAAIWLFEYVRDLWGAVRAIGASAQLTVDS